MKKLPSYEDLDQDDPENPEESLEDLYNLQPYTSVSDRPPLPDPKKPAAIEVPSKAPVRESVMQRIKEKVTPTQEPISLPSSAPSLDDYDSDPQMQSFNEDQVKLDELRDVKRDDDFISNLGYGFSSLSRGVGTPDTSNGLSKAMSSQSEFDLKSKQGDLDRRAKIIQAIEARKGRYGRNNELESQKDSYRQEKLLEAQKKEARSELSKLNKSLTEETASGRTAFGIAARNLQAISNAEALISGEIDLNNLDTRQLYELSKVQDRILSNGQPTISGTEHLDPRTVYRKTQEQLEKITNRRRGAGGADFVKTIQHTLEREKQSARNQINATHRKQIAGKQFIKDILPSEWAEVMHEHRLGGDETGNSRIESSEAQYVPILNPVTGKVKNIPADKVEEALAAGGKRVE